MKKKLIMILCAVVSLSLAACGGTVENDSDSRTEREVEDDDNEDREEDDDKDKEDKDRSGSDKSILDIITKNNVEEITSSYEEVIEEEIAQVETETIEIKSPYESLEYLYVSDLTQPIEKIFRFMLNDLINDIAYYSNMPLMVEKHGYAFESLFVSDYYYDDMIGIQRMHENINIIREHVNRGIYGNIKFTTYSNVKSSNLPTAYFYYKPDTKDEIYTSICVGFTEYSGDGKQIGEHKSYYRVVYALENGVWKIKKIDLDRTDGEVKWNNLTDARTLIDVQSTGVLSKREVLNKFVGDWVWEDDDMNGIYISKSLYNNTVSEYDFSISRGHAWSDIELFAFTDNQLYFDLNHLSEDYIVILTYIDENTIAMSSQGSSGLHKAIKRNSIESTQTTESTSTTAELQTIGNIDVESETTIISEDIDVELEVEKIRDYYSTTQNSLNSYMIEQWVGVTLYLRNRDTVKVFIISGYDDWDYAREYFYHDGELYFAFVYNDNEQHKLYFKDGIMIRYIDENGNTYDYGSLDAYSDWADKVKAESDFYYE